MDVRLIRQIDSPTGRGPGNGMSALQRALRAVRPDWLHIGGQLRDGEMPWFWCWEDRLAACACAAVDMPLVIGPNMLFANWTVPCAVAGERELCNAASCRLQFTESDWYRRWILDHCGPAMRAPIVLWPYPIDPLPDGPLPPAYDLLIYEKSGFDRATVEKLMRRWPASIRFRYGRFRREKLLNAARRARACVYLSNNDRGPLALAEILLCGCPAVGIARGAPWIVDGVTGFTARSFEYDALRTGESTSGGLSQFSSDENGTVPLPSATDIPEPVLIDAIQQAVALDRQAVRAAALERFDANKIVQTIIHSLDAARWD